MQKMSAATKLHPRHSISEHLFVLHEHYSDFKQTVKLFSLKLTGAQLYWVRHDTLQKNTVTKRDRKATVSPSNARTTSSTIVATVLYIRCHKNIPLTSLAFNVHHA